MADRLSSGRIPSTTIFIRKQRKLRWRSWKRPGAPSWFHRPAYAAGGLSTTLACSTWRPTTFAKTFVPYVGFSRPACRSSAWSRVASPSFGTSSRMWLPHDEDAKRLNQLTMTLGEFLSDELPDYRPPRLMRQAVVHGHCHQKAVMGLDGEEAIMKRMGLDYQVLNSGCCGMSGPFGFSGNIMRFHLRSASRHSCRRYERRPRMPLLRWSVSAVVNRLPTRPTDGVFIWLRFFAWPCMTKRL